MQTASDLLQGAAAALKMQIANLQGGRMQVPPGELLKMENGIIQALEAAEKAAPANGLIFYAVQQMDGLRNAPANVVRNAAKLNPGMSYTGSISNYLTDLNRALDIVQQAQQHPSNHADAAPSAAPVNRAAWTMAEWQRNDSAGLQAMMQDNTSEWQQLYKREMGTDYAPYTNPNKPR